MHVDAAVPRNVQNALRKDLSVCHDHDQVGRQRLQFFIGRIVTEALRLDDGQPHGKGVFLDR